MPDDTTGELRRLISEAWLFTEQFKSSEKAILLPRHTLLIYLGETAENLDYYPRCKVLTSHGVGWVVKSHVRSAVKL